MVSGFVTSPWDQVRIFSGLARRILIESKSITTLPTSTLGRMGIIRLMGSLPSRGFFRPPTFQNPRRGAVPESPGRSLSPLVLRPDQLHVETQALELANQDVERFGQPRREHRVALDDRLVDLGPSVDVVGLRGQELLEDVGRAV